MGAAKYAQFRVWRGERSDANGPCQDRHGGDLRGPDLRFLFPSNELGGLGASTFVSRPISRVWSSVLFCFRPLERDLPANVTCISVFQPWPTLSSLELVGWTQEVHDFTVSVQFETKSGRRERGALEDRRNHKGGLWAALVMPYRHGGFLRHCVRAGVSAELMRLPGHVRQKRPIDRRSGTVGRVYRS